MPAQSRRPANRPTRSQRRAGVQTTRTYNVPAANVATGRAVAPRRTFVPEPQPIDHTEEFGFIRQDLIRILLWAGAILAIMIVLAFLKPYIF